MIYKFPSAFIVVHASFQVIRHPRLAVRLETCIQEVLASNLGRDTGYPDCGFWWSRQTPG
jgi:hypothetical protein